MIASQLSEVIWGGAAMLLIGGLGGLIMRNKIDMVRLKAGPIEASVDMASVHKELKKVVEIAERIDNSTNHRRDGEPTLAAAVKETQERVQVIEDSIRTIRGHQDHERNILAWQNVTLREIAHHVGYTPTDAPVDKETP